MIATLVPIDLKLPPSKLPRSEGIHVSSLIRCIAAETGILKAEWVEDLSLSDVRDITEPVAVLRISIGLAWEEWYIPQILTPLYGVVDHPGEMQVEGIYMTHDGESLDTVITYREVNLTILALHEVKATYKSINTVWQPSDDGVTGSLDSQWLWMAQCKAYCKGAGTNVIYLHVLFLCGDYSFPIRPVLMVWRIEFTDAEIEDGWGLVRDYRDDRVARGDTGV